MSQPFSRFLHPFDVARHPSLEPEVKRSILASWASDRSAVRDQPAPRKRQGGARRETRRSPQDPGRGGLAAARRRQAAAFRAARVAKGRNPCRRDRPRADRARTRVAWPKVIALGGAPEPRQVRILPV